MNISPLKITRAMREDIAESRAIRSVSLQGERFDQSAVGEINTNNQWVELYDEVHSVVLGREGRIVECHYENRNPGIEKVGHPVCRLEEVPDIVDAAYKVAAAYGNPKVKPMELKAIIDMLVEILQAAGYDTSTEVQTHE